MIDLYYPVSSLQFLPNIPNHWNPITYITAELPRSFSTPPSLAESESVRADQSTLGL